MRILYLDCYSGISGDMFLGALVDAGCGITLLKKELSKLNLKGYKIETKKTKRGGISSTRFDVIIDKNIRDERKSLKDILNIIQKSRLDNDVKEKAARIFKSLAEAEGRVHKKSLKHLHFHEIGDIDSIVDIAGAAAALKILKIDKVYSSQVFVGGGAVIKTKGGVLPIPAPATLYLLKNIPIAHSDISSELVTPTGAAILANLVDGFSGAPPFVLKRVGYGAGRSDFKERPNCLRVIIGEEKEAFLQDRIFVIETNIDDMNPVDYEHLMNRLFREGALDVSLTPVQMKKSRPGILLTVLAEKDGLDKLCRVILSESAAIGVRYYEAERKKLKRVQSRINTKYGKITLKVSSGPGGIKKVMPEYADCKRIAETRKIPIAQIREELAGKKRNVPL